MHRFLHSIVLNLIALIVFQVAAFAADFTGLVVSVLDGDTLEVLHNQHPDRIRLNGASTAQRKAKPLASGPSKPPLTSPSGKKSRSRLTASISTGARLPTCFSRMELTPITRESKRACAGGIGSMRQENGVRMAGE